MIRPQLSMVAAGAAVVLGLAGLVGGAVTSSGAAAKAPAGIVVSGAYVREPASPTVAAAYFTIYNTTNRDDTLVTVSTGAGEAASLHTDTGGQMALTPAGLKIPAHGSAVLKPGIGHVMIEKLYDPLLPGQTVSVELTFQTAGVQLVQAPVIAITDPAPVAVAP